MKLTNAIIEKVEINNDRCFSLWVHVKGDHWGQGYGGYCFDEYNKETKERECNSAYGIECIRLLMKTFEVEKFSQLAGKPCRIEKDAGSINSSIDAIWHFLKEERFSFKDLADKFYPKKDDIN